ncbi:MAG: hypothetical protein ABIB71_09770 [Candidatus Woesearchaeota archaeon]
MKYEIWLDLVNYKQYPGNIERELTDFIFGSRWSINSYDTFVPEEWEGKLLSFMHEDYGEVLSGIEGKIYNSKELKKYDLEGKSYDGAQKDYHCFRIFWKFELKDDKEAKETSEFLVEKSKDFMKKKQKKKKRDVPTEIYKIQKTLVEI